MLNLFITLASSYDGNFSGTGEPEWHILFFVGGVILCVIGSIIKRSKN